MLKNIMEALGLGEGATLADARKAFDQFLTQEAQKARAAGADPRVTLRELTDARMTEKKIPYAQALEEISTEHRALSEAAQDFYR
jgi:hypothetical protein